MLADVKNCIAKACEVFTSPWSKMAVSVIKAGLIFTQAIYLVGFVTILGGLCASATHQSPATRFHASHKRPTTLHDE